jgi:hypothetical protein
MCGVPTRVEAFIDSIWTYFIRLRGPRVLDRSSPPASTGRKTKMWRFLDTLAAPLQEEGAMSFVKSWIELMAVIASRSAALSNAS